MNIKTLVAVCAVSAALVACGGGDIKIDAQNNTDNSINGDNSGNVGGGSEQPTVNPCAQYSAGGIVRQGSYADSNCTYGSDFVDLTNPITTTDLQVTFADLPSDGVHVFEGSLVVGRNYDSTTALNNAGIFQGGDGAVIRIDAGATLAFQSSDDYMVINRGSQIFAEGTANAPITITSVSDAIDGTVDAEAVSEWGGLIINGFGVTNKCGYTGVRGVDLALTGDCDVPAEGKGGSAQTYYGGANDDDNSGILSYVIVKHTGAQVAVDNELNGISFDAVGRGTTVEYIQAYSTYDDGIEMFGGAVDISNYVAVYVRDDSIDIDEGYIGTIDHALVVQSEGDGQQCLESDGIGSYKSDETERNKAIIDAGLNSAATLRNVTCIISPVAAGTHGVGAGLRIREGHYAKIYNSLVTTAYMADGVADDTDENQCVRLDDAETLAGADAGNVTISNSIIACQDLTKGGPVSETTTLLAWLEGQPNDVMQTAEAGQNPTAAEEPNLIILDGFYSVPLADMVIDGNVATVTPNLKDEDDDTDYIGAVTATDDWTAGWAYGLHDGNRGKALWFE